MSDREIDPNSAVEFLFKSAQPFAQAKANRVYLEEFRKTKKAILMRSSGEKVIGSQESFAYSHPEYLAVLEGIKEAVVEEERLRWEMIAAQARIEVYRSQEASKRVEYRATL